MEVEKVAKAIAYLRKRAGYTQKDLAERLGVSDKAVSKWERGLGLPDISSLRKLSVLLDTDTDSLLAGDVIHHDSGWCGLLMLDQTDSGVDLRTMVYDKPMVYFLLGYFLLVGIMRIMVVCSEEEIAYMQKEFGDGSGLGIHLYYSKGDVHDALQSFPHMDECTNFMIVYGRTFIYGVDQTRFFHKAMVERDRLTVLSLPKGRKAATQRLCFNDDKKIICESDTEELNTQYQYYDIPVLFCPKNLLKPVCDVIASGSIAADSLLKDRYLYTEVLDRGFVEMTMDSWEEVLGVSSFVKIVEQACGMNLYSIEEIAWRRGFISTEQLFRLAEQKQNEEYAAYLKRLHEDV